jgi:hypothetical protein
MMRASAGTRLYASVQHDYYVGIFRPVVSADRDWSDHKPAWIISSVEQAFLFDIIDPTFIATETYSFFFFKKGEEGRPDFCKLPSFFQGATILGRTFSLFLSKKQLVASN